jgi:hypothetical protein
LIDQTHLLRPIQDPCHGCRGDLHFSTQRVLRDTVLPAQEVQDQGLRGGSPQVLNLGCNKPGPGQAGPGQLKEDALSYFHHGRSSQWTETTGERSVISMETFHVVLLTASSHSRVF